MYKSILLCTIGLVLVPAFWSASAQPAGNGGGDKPAMLSPEQQALIDIEKSWAKAITARDIKTLDRIMADDFIDTGSLGGMSSKADLLQSIKSGSGPARRNQLQDLIVHVYDDAAIVKGLNVVLDEQGNFLRRVRFTDTFVKRDGEWKAVAGHECVVVTP
jgi:ketosteroid isomerase-like protein